LCASDHLGGSVDRDRTCNAEIAMTSFIPVYLSRGLIALVDADQEDRVLERKWCAVNHKGTFYAASRCRSDTLMLYLHRLVMQAPDGVQVRFLNKVTLDCRRANLRLCTEAEREWDRRSTPGHSSVFRGVDRMPARPCPWRAQIEHLGTKHFLGVYGSEEEAAKAYDAAARCLKGPRAVLNFPTE
jgi:hypothetical protein